MGFLRKIFLDWVEEGSCSGTAGADKFRLDAILPEGIRSLVLYRLGGILKEPDGTVREFPSTTRLLWASSLFHTSIS
jgi:hypothetical protein